MFYFLNIRNKKCFSCLHSPKKISSKFLGILEQVKSSGTASRRVFTDLLSNYLKLSPWFSPGYEGTEKMFYFLIELETSVITMQRSYQLSYEATAGRAMQSRL